MIRVDFNSYIVSDRNVCPLYQLSCICYSEPGRIKNEDKNGHEIYEKTYEKEKKK